MPILSIITINLNNAQGLKKTMQSVFEQSNLKKDQVEYIIIDGASTDDSVNVIKELEKQYKKSPIKLKWISEKDTGIYNAMNKGVKMATGSLIALMNSGDSYLPDIFSNIIVEHNNAPDAILYGAVKTFKEDTFQSICGYNYTVLPEKMIPHQGTFVPSTLFEKHGLFDESFKIAADYDLFLKYYKNDEHFIFINKIIAEFNLDGISMQNYTNITEKEQIEIKKRYGYYIPPSKKEILKKQLKEFIKTVFPFLR